VAVALEAFPSGKQFIFNRWIERTLDEHDFEGIYKETWSVPMSTIGNIDVRERGEYPLIAINADNAMIGAVSKYGLHQVSEDFLREIKFTDCSTDAQYKEIIGKTYHAAEFLSFVMDSASGIRLWPIISHMHERQ